jgi:hypothetical protein
MTSTATSIDTLLSAFTHDKSRCSIAIQPCTNSSAQETDALISRYRAALTKSFPHAGFEVRHCVVKASALEAAEDSTHECFNDPEIPVTTCQEAFLGASARTTIPVSCSRRDTARNHGYKQGD